MNVGENIRKIRKAKGLTMKELGKNIGISEQGIGNYEREDRKPDFEVLNKIAEALGCRLSDLLGVDPPEPEDDYFQQYLRSLGYEILFDEENIRLVLHTKDYECEITEKDEFELRSTAKSFIEYKLHEITNRSRKIGK